MDTLNSVTNDETLNGADVCVCVCVCSQFREIEKVVLEDREEQAKLRQQQAELSAAIQVTTRILYLLIVECTNH